MGKRLSIIGNVSPWKIVASKFNTKEIINVSPKNVGTFFFFFHFNKSDHCDFKNKWATIELVDEI